MRPFYIWFCICYSEFGELLVPILLVCALRKLVYLYGPVIELLLCCVLLQYNYYMYL
uniref:Uncharacterized protein n=1 Tax=Arundo donax TaxID=35708 RepID=A0A0A9AFP3_ARUDO